MGKVLTVIGTVVAVVGLAIVTGGAAAGLGISLATSAFGVSAGTLLAVGAGLSVLGGLTTKSPKISSANADRTSVNIDPRTPRKIIFGHTAMATDLRDQEWSSDQAYLHRFVVCASHRVQSIDEIWFDDKQAWTASGGVTSTYAGYLTVTAITQGSAANAINIGPRIGSSRRYTGLAYVYFRYKTTGNSKKTQSPFASSIPTRVTIIGKGMAVYDPRRDSTVSGGSGSQRANDQTTWAWDDNAARNPALQLLTYLLGWRIQNPTTSAWKLAVGKGLPPARIDLASFAVAANLCDETVSKSDGGTEPRYRTDGILSEGDDLSTVLDSFKASMNADVDDADGRLRIIVYHNDLSAPIGSLDDDDVIGDVRWTPASALSDTITVVRGNYTDPSSNSLYQAIAYPDVSITPADGIERSLQVDLPLVQSPSQAQRLGKQRLQRSLYPGVFEGTFQATAWKFQKGDVIRLTFSALGFSAKLFRIVAMTVRIDGTVPMLLREENAAIYAWDASDAPAVSAAAPTTYDPLRTPVQLELADLATTPNNVNLILFSDFGQGARGWGVAPSGAVTIDSGFPYAGTDSTGPYYQMEATSSGAGYYGFYSPPFNVTPGARYAAQVGLGSGQPALSYSALAIGFYDGSGAFIANSPDLATLAGSQPTNTKMRGFFVVPAGAVQARMLVNSFSNGTSALIGSHLREPMVSSATADQTEFPSYTSGRQDGAQGIPGNDGLPGARGADGASAYRWVAYADSPDGTLNFSTGAPGGRTYQGIADNKSTSAESTDPADYTWSQYVGPPNFGLVASAGAMASGAKIYRTAAYTGDWNQQVYSSESFRGGAALSFRHESATGYMVALNEDPTTNADWTSLDYAIYVKGISGMIYATNNGVFVFDGGTSSVAAPGDTFGIQYDGKSVRYTRNGAEFFSQAAAADKRLWFDSSLGGQGFGFTLLSFTGAGPAGNNGTDALSVSASATSISVPSTANGTPKAALPGFFFTVFKGATNVTATASGTTYSADTPSNLTGVTHVGNGVFSVSAMTADTGFVDITVANGGASQVVRISYSKAKDGPAFNYTDSAIGPPPSTSYTVVWSVQLTAGPNGNFDIAFDGGFGAASGSHNVNGFVEYSLNGSSWTSIGTLSTVASSPTDDGTFSFMSSPSGASLSLSAKQTVYFRLQMRQAAATTYTSFAGSGSVQWAG